MNTRLTLRLSVPIMAASCLPLLAALYAAWDFHLTQRNTSRDLALNLTSMRAAEEIAIGVRDVRTRLDTFLRTNDPTALADIARLRKETDHWLGEAQRTAVTPREKELIADLTRSYIAFFVEVDALQQPRPDEKVASIAKLETWTQEILHPAQQYLDYNEDESQRNGTENHEASVRMVFGLLLLSVCGPLSGLIVGYGISRAISRSVVRLSVPVLDATGKLNGVVEPVAVSAGLGLEELEAVLQRMAGQVGRVVERLQQSQREALRAEQLAAVGQMAAGFAHELRNPLMSMKILVQSAAGRGDDPALHGRDLAVLEEEINRLEQLTSSLLNFARPPQPRLNSVDVRELIDDVVDLVSGKAGQRDIRIACALPDEAVRLDADAGQMRQVLLNLLLNAVEAVQENGVITVSTGTEGESVWLRVSDTGPGLPVGREEEIFAPFVSTKATGIGLGLSITKRIVETHGGTITAVNQITGGAMFVVSLPRLKNPTRHSDRPERLQGVRA